MHLRDHPGTAAGILLACIAAHYAVSDRARTWPRDTPLLAPAPHALPPAGSSARKTLDWCRENVAMVADVYWASACTAVAGEQQQRRRTCDAASESEPANRADPLCAPGAPTPDDSPDCTLPDERARPLNAARAKAEQMCLDDALAIDRRRH